MNLPFILTSVGYSSFRSNLLPLDEVPADGIYSMSLDSKERTLTRYPWLSALEDQPEASLCMVRRRILICERSENICAH